MWSVHLLWWVGRRRIRFGGCEPHNVAAYIGGVASQEAIKVRGVVHCRPSLVCPFAAHGDVCVCVCLRAQQIIVQQFRPMLNTHIFVGVNGSAGTLEL